MRAATCAERCAALGLVALFAGACVAGGEPAAKEETIDGSADAWSYGNRPETFGVDIVTRRLEDLPRQGQADHVPWAETYWPTVEDSFNARWQGQGELSPLEKYDVAFNGWVPPEGFMSLRPLTPESCASGAWDRAYYDQLGPAARYWSDTHGVGRARNGVDDDGDGRVDECDDMDGMEGWWGHCHAWTQAALLEDEPLEPVVVNGVRFEVSDVKALLILMYEERSEAVLGERCMMDNPERDATGRITDPDCRNVNAGSFHLLATNLLGLHRLPFGEDRTATRQVWNQPVYGYRITSQQEIGEAEACRLLNLAGGEYVYNPGAVRFAEVRMDLDYVVESYPSTSPTSPHIADYVRTDSYHYVLEMDADGQVVGGEWIGSGAHSRPDYLSLGLGAGRMTNPHVDVADVRELHRLSRPDLRSGTTRFYRQVEDQPIRDYPYPGVTSTIEVEEDFVVDEATVSVSVLHDWIYDVQVVLRRNGSEHVLFDRNPRGASVNLFASFTVTELAGQSAAGAWELYVCDRNMRAIGRLSEWSLELRGRGGDVEPGEPTEPDEPTDPSGPTERTFSSVGGAVPIPDNAPAGIDSVITVPTKMTAGRVRVVAEITHPWRGDLRVALVHGGVEHVLHDRSGGSAHDLHLDAEVPTFAGARVEGDWTLRVSDRARADTGQLDGWSLVVTPR